MEVNLSARRKHAHKGGTLSPYRWKQMAISLLAVLPSPGEQYPRQRSFTTLVSSRAQNVRRPATESTIKVVIDES